MWAPHFKDFVGLTKMPLFILPFISKFLFPITNPSLLGGSIRIFRSGQIVMSLLNGHEHRFGLQRLSFVVAVEQIVFWLESGQKRVVNDKFRAERCVSACILFVKDTKL